MHVHVESDPGWHESAGANLEGNARSTYDIGINILFLAFFFLFLLRGVADFIIYFQKINKIKKKKTGGVFRILPKPGTFFPILAPITGNFFSENSCLKPEKIFPISNSGKKISGF